MTKKKWEAIDKNGNKIDEDDINWDLVKDKVKSLSLNNNEQIISLPDNMEYVQGKTASAILGSGKIQVESRYIGLKIGNKVVKVRVNEQTNNISIEVEDEPNNISDPRRT